MDFEHSARAEELLKLAVFQEQEILLKRGALSPRAVCAHRPVDPAACDRGAQGQGEDRGWLSGGQREHARVLGEPSGQRHDRELGGCEARIS